MRQGSQLLEAIRRRVMGTLAPAIVGGILGLLYARFSLDAETIQRSNYPGLYSAVGAASGILFVRLASLVRMIFSDFLKR